MLKQTKQKSQFHDEADELLADVMSFNGSGNPGYRLDLKQRLLMEAETKPSIFSLFTNLFMYKINRRMALSVATVLGLSAVGALSYIYLGTGSKLEPADITAQELFESIANAKESNSTATTMATGEAKLAADSLLIAPQEENTFTKNTTTSEVGPKSQSCTGYVQFGMDYSVSTYYSYYNSTVGSKNRSEIKDRNGKIYTYNLTSDNKLIEYYGGSYAVRTESQFATLYNSDLVRTQESSSDAATSDVVDTTLVDPVPTEETSFNINDYFGPDAQVLGQEEINGKNYYVVSWSYDGFCDEATPNVKIFTKVWVDTNEFMYYKDEVYLNSIAEENLIVRNTYENEKRVVDFSEVASNFNFDLNVSIKDVDINSNQPGSEAYDTAMINMIGTRDVKVLQPADQTYKIDSAYANRLDLPNPNDFRQDRNFYATDAVGTKMHKDNSMLYEVDETQNSYLNVGYSKQEGELYSNFSFELFDVSTNMVELENRVNSGGVIPAENVTLKINNESVAAKMFDQSKAYTPEVGTDGTMPACPNCMTTYSFIATYSNHIYIISITGNYDSSTVLNFGINYVDGGTDAGVNQITQLFDSIEYSPLIAL